MLNKIIWQLNWHWNTDRKSGSEIGSVCVMMSTWFWIVYFLALRAVELYHCLSRHIWETDWQHCMIFAINTISKKKSSIIMNRVVHGVATGKRFLADNFTCHTLIMKIEILPWTVAKITLLIFLEHLGNSTIR